MRSAPTTPAGSLRFKAVGGADRAEVPAPSDFFFFFPLSHFWFFLQNNLPNLDYFRAAAHPEKSPSSFSFNHPIDKHESWMALREKKRRKRRKTEQNPVVELWLRPVQILG